MNKTAVTTTLMETRNAAAAAKTGRQRAAIHNNIGKRRATGSTVSQACHGSEIAIPVITASATSAVVPSMSSLRDGGRRMEAASPITSGATMMIPITSDANQCCQVVSMVADGP